MGDEKQGEKLLTNDEVAKMLGILPATLAVWRSTERYPLRYVKIGTCVRYRVSDIEAWIKTREVLPSGEAQRAQGVARD